MNLKNEKDRLETIALQYDPEADWEEIKIILMAADLVCENASDPGSALELGTSTGLMTQALARYFHHIVAVDGSAKNLETTGQRLAAGGLQNVELVEGLFETYQPGRTFPNIIMAHVLEHVEDPVEILRYYKQNLSPGGIIHAAVPNAASLNRRIGFQLGMMKTLNQLGPKDHMVGHRRLYTHDMLYDHIDQAGLEPVVCLGIFLKPLSKAQMAHWKDELVEAFFQIGRELPAYAMDIYMAARNPA
jgi:2-polyprenyl-3-methyl-5-hydroxy-6-metoxy-1,4-benzoquinol methylase